MFVQYCSLERGLYKVQNVREVDSTHTFMTHAYVRQLLKYSIFDSLLPVIREVTFHPSTVLVISHVLYKCISFLQCFCKFFCNVKTKDLCNNSNSTMSNSTNYLQMHDAPPTCTYVISITNENSTSKYTTHYYSSFFKGLS